MTGRYETMAEVEKRVLFAQSVAEKVMAQYPMIVMSALRGSNDSLFALMVTAASDGSLRRTQ